MNHESHEEEMRHHTDITMTRTFLQHGWKYKKKSLAR